MIRKLYLILFESARISTQTKKNNKQKSKNQYMLLVCIGFIGLSAQDYECEFTPFVDIGWRLAKHTWNKGYATEGAKRCLSYAHETLKLKEIYAVTPMLNKKSERIMQKIGMTKVGTFEHPLLLNDERLKMCVLYCKKSKL